LRNLAFCLVLVCMSGLTARADSGAVPGYLQKDMHELIAIMRGRWDNDGHVFFAVDAGMDPATVAPREHQIISPVDGSEGRQLRVVRKAPGLPDRELFYTFRVNPAANRVDQAILHADGSSAGCDVSWARSGEGFSGIASGEGCAALFPKAVGKGPLRALMTLSPDAFWTSSSRGGATVESRMRRARVFSCWTSVLRGAHHGDSGEGEDDWYFQRDILIQDQGGNAVLMTDETPPRKIEFKLRDVDWTYGANRPSLTLYIHEGENDRATSYAWAEGGAGRIGINLRWIQASCTFAADEEFVDLSIFSN